MSRQLPTRHISTNTDCDRYEISFSHNGTYVASRPLLASQATTIIRTDEAKQVGMLPGDFCSVDFSLIDDIAIASRNGISVVWQMSPFQEMTRFHWGDDSDVLVQARFLKTNQFFLLGKKVSGSIGNSLLSIWDTSNWKECLRYTPLRGETIMSVFNHNERLSAVSLRPPNDRNQVYKDRLRRLLMVTDLGSGNTEKLTDLYWPCEAFQLSCDGTIGVICKDIESKEYEIWDFTTGQRLAIITFDQVSPEFGFSSKFGYLVHCHATKPGIGKWDIRTGKLIEQLSDVNGVRPICSPCYPLFAIITHSPEGRGGEALFISAETGETLGSGDGHSIINTDAHRFSNCGRWFASVTSNLLDQVANPGLSSGELLLTDLKQIQLD